FNTPWQTGSGGSIPSMIAYVFGVVGVFRLVRDMLTAGLRPEIDAGAKPAAAVGAGAAAFVYGANPNLIYMQATAMTESVHLALFIWAVVYFTEFVRGLRATSDAPARAVRTPLMRCAWCLAGAELTRYDGWFLAGAIGAAAAFIALRRWQDYAVRRLAVKFLLAIAAIPVLWLAYNAAVYGNALDFANGPYSAKAIEQRVAAPNPALHHVGVAAIYFLKSAQLNLANGNWGRFWLAAAFLALAIGARKLRPQSAPLLLLWVPLPFYAFSIAYGSVPIHVSTWWPFVAFNQRYGLQLLPMFAVSVGVLAASAFLPGAIARRSGKKAAVLFAFVLFALTVVSYTSLWISGPQCLVEAQKNWQTRRYLNSEVQQVVSRLPRNSRFLMDTHEHVGIMEQAGIPLRQVVNNEDHRPWKRPSDPDGLWERALADPARYVDYVIAFDGDAVDQRANRANLTEMMEIHATGQPHARIYATPTDPN